MTSKITLIGGIIVGVVIVVGLTFFAMQKRAIAPHSPEQVASTTAPTPAAPSPAPAKSPSPMPMPVKTTPPPSGNAEVCTQDLKECPDGSFVTRGGPQCEFAACPSGTKVSGLPVQIALFQFSPATIQVHQGTTVVWTNKDSASHTVTGNNGGPSSGTLAPGQSYSYTFNTLGTFSYHCAFHPSMTGTVTVVP